jgi:hypothetical protein
MNQDESHLVYFGDRFVWGPPGIPIAITNEDRRRHLYIIGRPGAGKSRLMENLCLQDIYAGLGAAFIDPHGTSAKRILDHIPSARTRDVVYFRPADLERPIGLNILENVAPDNKDHVHLVTQGVVGAFKSVWRDFWGPRMERILSNAIAALLEQRTATLLGVLRVLVDNAYRERIVVNITDPVIRAFWENEYPEYQKQFKQKAISPIQNKVERFLSSFVMRNIFGQKKSAIDFFDLMNSNKIFIANLSKGEIGDMNCNLAGSLLLTQFYLAALKRITLGEEERTLYPLYVDEIHSFATESFGDILAETRKFGLSLCAAHQPLDQLDKVDESLRSAVLASGTLIAFRVGGEDADVLRKEFAPWPAQTLVDLDNFVALIKLLRYGKVMEPFQIQMYETPPHIKLQDGRSKSVANFSRDNYGTPRALVEAEIERWMQGLGQKASEATLKRVARTIAPKQKILRKNRG